MGRTRQRTGGFFIALMIRQKYGYFARKMKIGLGSGRARILTLFVLYTLGLWASLWLAYKLRFDFDVPASLMEDFCKAGFLVVAIKLACLLGFRQFAGLLSYFSTPDLAKLFYALSVGAGTIAMVRYSAGIEYAPPRGIILLDLVISFLGLSAMRLVLRLYRERQVDPSLRGRSALRVGIVGAGDVGASLAKELMIKRGLGLSPVVFFDDDSTKWHSRVHGLPVAGAPEVLLEPNRNLGLDEVIIAMPSASAKRIGEIVRILNRTRLKYQTVPSIHQLATGQVRVSQLRSVDIEDLLGRDPVELETDNIRQMIHDRVILVTGAGGSIGSELCRQIVIFNPALVILVDQSEVQLFPIEQELIELGYKGNILPLVADILDGDRMRFIFDRFHPQVLFHAAAHKHVPMMESQPSEAFKNNSMGTARLAEMALAAGIERFVMISTDKAINPTNVMGASKRLAEIYLQALAARNPDRTKIMAVRFGNVLGSSGSVVPIFHRQIAAGGPVKVTHPDVTRYFMTIPEAVGLVLQSAAQGQGGEIFVLDMGQPIKIVDLARQMIELSGFKPDEDIAIEFVGLRPGEKLYEELSYKGENVTPTNHPKIMRFISEPQALEDVQSRFDELSKVMHQVEPAQLKLLLQKAVPEYKPYLV